MRYHFHVCEAGEIILDEEGSECATLEAARIEACASLRDLAIEDIRNGAAAHAWRVDISTCEGRVLDSISLQVFEPEHEARVHH